MVGASDLAARFVFVAVVAIVAVVVSDVGELVVPCGFVDPGAGRAEGGFVVATTGGLRGVAVGSGTGASSDAVVGVGALLAGVDPILAFAAFGVEVSRGTKGVVVAVRPPGAELSTGGREVLAAALVSVTASDGGDGGGVEGGADVGGWVDSGTSGTTDDGGGGSVEVTSAIGAIVAATLVAVVGAGGLGSVTVNRRTPLAVPSLLDAVQRRT